MAANYNCLLIDVDGTLLDFAAAEEQAILGTLQAAGLPATAESAQLYSEINNQLWAQLERGEIRKEKLVVRRFQRLLEELSAEGDAVRLNNDYLTRLSQGAATYPGADEMLAELAEFCTLAAVTNGIHRVQMNRLEKSGLLPYFDDVFVSEKMGATKPSPKIFEKALKMLGVTNKQKVLMVGDSLSADIKGGQAAGIDTCWCNFQNAENTTGIEPTYTIQSFPQLKLIAVGEEELKRAQNREKRHIV